MNDYSGMFDGEQAALIIDRLSDKGKGLLDLCLEREKSLGMKGFIDCQIEKGGMYTRVVENMINYIDHEIREAPDRKRRTFLLDLQNYAVGQLRTTGQEALIQQTGMTMDNH